MADYKFNPHERLAVFSVHRERCYMCRKPLDLMTMEVDHVIPESLRDRPSELAAVLKELGRPPSFDVNSFENWLPACRACNAAKLDIIFDPAPIILVWLQIAGERAEEARRIANKSVRDRDIAKALNTLARAKAAGGLDKDTLKTLAGYVMVERDKNDLDLLVQPVRITPLYEVLAENGGLLTIRGPYGIGARPVGRPDSSFDCPSCGSIAAWNGARCVICGMQDDD